MTKNVYSLICAALGIGAFVLTGFVPGADQELRMAGVGLLALAIPRVGK